jgi:hypothetical protein
MSGGLWAEIFICLFVGSAILGAAGFGFGMVAMGFLSLTLTLQESTLLVLSLSLICTGIGMVRLHRFIRFELLVGLVGAGLLGRLGSYWFLQRYGETPTAQNILGALLIASAVYVILTARTSARPTFVRHPAVYLSVGLVDAFVGGVFALGGPLIAMYFLFITKNKEEYLANSFALSIIQNCFTLLLYTANGSLSSTFWTYILIGTIAVLAGGWVGLSFFQKLSQEGLKWVIVTVTLIAGINVLIFS